jgi:beta-carotene ketolase (CrtO type)
VASLEASLEAAGGRIRHRYPVSAVTRSPEGWLVSAPGTDSILATTAVVSAIPPQAMLLELVTPVPANLRRRMGQVETVSANLSQFSLAAALRQAPPLGSLAGSGFEGSQLWLLTDPAAVLASPAAALTGSLARRPGVLVTFPSVIDPSVAPGAASMWANGFLANRLARPGGWAGATEDATERIWSTVESCLPGTRELVTESVFTTPADLTARTGAMNPGTHVSATLAQLLGGRPARGCADHRSGIDGIYLTGAGTNPGPSVSGLPGRACAEALLEDLRARQPGGRLRATRRDARAEWSRAVNISAMAVRARRAGRSVDRPTRDVGR